MARTVTPDVVAHVKRFEGCKLTAYPDPGSINGEPWTIGYGHTSDSFMPVRKACALRKRKPMPHWSTI